MSLLDVAVNLIGVVPEKDGAKLGKTCIFKQVHQLPLRQ